jgi:hypothetical protein
MRISTGEAHARAVVVPPPVCTGVYAAGTCWYMLFRYVLFRPQNTIGVRPQNTIGVHYVKNGSQDQRPSKEETQPVFTPGRGVCEHEESREVRRLKHPTSGLRLGGDE